MEIYSPACQDDTSDSCPCSTRAHNQGFPTELSVARYCSTLSLKLINIAESVTFGRSEFHEEDHPTANFTLSGNLTLNTLEALDDFRKMANADADYDSDPEDDHVPLKPVAAPVIEAFTILEDENLAPRTIAPKKKTAGIPFREIHWPEVEVDPSANPYLKDGYKGTGYAQPQLLDDFVIYEDPVLELKSRSPPVNEALYQEFKVSEDCTDVDIIGKNLSQLLANASDVTDSPVRDFKDRHTNTNFSEGLLAQIREDEPSFYQSTGGFQDTGSFLKGLADLDEDTIGNPGPIAGDGLDFVR